MKPGTAFICVRRPAFVPLVRRRVAFWRCRCLPRNILECCSEKEASSMRRHTTFLEMPLLLLPRQILECNIKKSGFVHATAPLVGNAATACQDRYWDAMSKKRVRSCLSVAHCVWKHYHTTWPLAEWSEVFVGTNITLFFCEHGCPLRERYLSEILFWGRLPYDNIIVLWERLRLPSLVTVFRACLFRCDGSGYC